MAAGTVERIGMRKVAPSLSCPTVTAVWVVNGSFRLERAELTSICHHRFEQPRGIAHEGTIS
jgi:hypothetical protein